MRNYYLDLLKLISIIIVCFYHTAWFDWLHHGYLPVEFFFIVSGYFIYRACCRRIPLGTFLKKKFGRILPVYYPILLMYILAAFFLPFFFYGKSYSYFGLSVLRDLCLSQSTGLFDLLGYDFLRFNNPDWYLSSYLWGGCILFIVVTYLRRSIYILYALSGIIIGTYGTYLLSGQDLNGLWGYYKFLFMPLWRGLAGMSLGCLIGIIADKKSVCDLLNRHRSIFNILTALSFLIIFWVLITPMNFDFIGVGCFGIVILNAVLPFGLSKFTNSKIFSLIPDITLEILLLHYILIPVSVKISDLLGVLSIDCMKCGIYVVVVIISAILFKHIVTPSISILLSRCFKKAELIRT